MSEAQFTELQQLFGLGSECWVRCCAAMEAGDMAAFKAAQAEHKSLAEMYKAVRQTPFYSSTIH